MCTTESVPFGLKVCSFYQMASSILMSSCVTTSDPRQDEVLVHFIALVDLKQHLQRDR